jgi:hypothetical protein
VGRRVASGRRVPLLEQADLNAVGKSALLREAIAVAADRRKRRLKSEGERTMNDYVHIFDTTLRDVIISAVP